MVVHQDLKASRAKRETEVITVFQESPDQLDKMDLLDQRVIREKLDRPVKMGVKVNKDLEVLRAFLATLGFRVLGALKETQDQPE